MEDFSLNFSDNLSHKEMNKDVWSKRIILWKRERLLFLSNFKLYKYFGERSSINLRRKSLSWDLIAEFILETSSWDGKSIFFKRAKDISE